MPPLQGGRFCYIHDPARARDRADSRRRAGQATRGRRSAGEATRGPRAVPPDADPVPLRTVDAVLTVLERTVGETLALPRSVARSRTVGALLGVALKALEVGEWEARLAALEQQTREAR
jgi:hypothetical protein